METLYKFPFIFKAEVSVSFEQIQNLLTEVWKNGCCKWMRLYAPDIQREAKLFNDELEIEKLVLMGGTLPVYEDTETDNLTKIGEISVINIVKALQAIAYGEDLKGTKNDALRGYFSEFIRGNLTKYVVETIAQIAVMGEIRFKNVSQRT